MKKYETFDEYLKVVNDTGKEWIIRIRKIVKETLPNAYETMGYGVPAFGLRPNAKLNEKIMVACYKNHLGFYPHPSTVKEFKDKLVNYKVLEGTVQIKYNQVLPEDLIREMLLYRDRMLNDE